MDFMTRRDFLSLASTGIAVGAVSDELNAQAPKENTTPLPERLDKAAKVAETAEVFAEDYFWLNDHTLVFLRLTPHKGGFFRAVILDTTTGLKTLPEEFNFKNITYLLGQQYGFNREGSNHWSYDYAPPRTLLSPEGQWLLWGTTFGSPHLQWVAATFDGRQQIWKQATDPKSEEGFVGNNAFWLRDGTGWVELVKKYAKRKYTLTRANIYPLDSASPVRTIAIEGLSDGLDVGVREDGRIMMFHPKEHQQETKQAVFSLIDLKNENAKAKRQVVPLPQKAKMMEVMLSPHGDRLAWVFGVIKNDVMNYELWISNSEGQEWKLLGEAGVIESGKHHYSYPRKVRWLPDGTRLSFMYDKTIRVLSVK